MPERPNQSPTPHGGLPRKEAGFTLIEAMAAMIILSFGLIAVTNLLIVAASSNQIAHLSTAATAQATEVAERIKAIPFNQIFPNNLGGDLNNDVGALGVCREPATANCVVAGGFNMQKDIDGVGTIRTRWQIVAPAAAGSQTLFIAVRSESVSRLGGVISRAEFTTFRSCTVAGCP